MPNVFEEVVSEVSGSKQPDIFASVIDEIKPVTVQGEEYTPWDIANPNLSSAIKTATSMGKATIGPLAAIPAGIISGAGSIYGAADVMGVPYAGQSADLLKDISESMMIDKGIISRGVQSTGQSIVGGLPGAVIGQAIAPGPIGAVTGFAVGAGGLFALDEYRTFMKDLEKFALAQGKSPEEVAKFKHENLWPALQSAIHEGGWEAASDLLQLKVMGFMGKTGAQLLKESTTPFVKKYAKALALNYPIEASTEGMTTLGQRLAREQAGLPTPEPLIKELVDTFGITGVQSVIQTFIGLKVSGRQQRKEFNKYVDTISGIYNVDKNTATKMFKDAVDKEIDRVSQPIDTTKTADTSVDSSMSVEDQLVQIAKEAKKAERVAAPPSEAKLARLEKLRAAKEARQAALQADKEFIPETIIEEQPSAISEDINPELISPPAVSEGGVEQAEGSISVPAVSAEEQAMFNVEQSQPENIEGIQPTQIEKEIIGEEELLTKHEANARMQNSLTTDQPMKPVRVGRKYKMQPMTPAEILANKSEPTVRVKKTKVKAEKRPAPEIVEQITEDLYTTHAEASEAMQSLMGARSEYIIVGDDDIGYTVTARRDIEEAIPSTDQTAPIVPSKYTPMPDADIQEGLAIQMNDMSSVSDIIKHLTAQVDNWFTNGKSGLQMPEIKSMIEYQFVKGQPQFNQKLTEIIERLTDAAKTRSEKTMSFMGTGELVDMIKQFPDDMRYVYELGSRAYERTSTTFEEFMAKAKQWLGDMWEVVKDNLKKAWDLLREQRGSISDWPLKNIYSKLEKTVEKMSPKINPKDALNKIRSEIKADELRMSGVEAFLKGVEEKGAALSRDELLRHIRESMLDIRVEVFGGTEGKKEAKYIDSWVLPGPKSNVIEVVFWAPEIERWGAEDTAHFGEVGLKLPNLNMDKIKKLKEDKDNIISDMLQIDIDNNRLLEKATKAVHLKHPEFTDDIIKVFKEKQKVEEQYSDGLITDLEYNQDIHALRTKRSYIDVQIETAISYEPEGKQIGENNVRYNNLIADKAEIAYKIYELETSQVEKGGQNLGWIRMNDRQLFDKEDNAVAGVRNLHLEESQNKRAMEARGRDDIKVFAVKGDEARLQRMLEDIKAEINRLVREKPKDYLFKVNDLRSKERAIIVRLREGLTVPYAPFLKDSVELHMKWLISHAIEQGYDTITINTAEQMSRLHSSQQILDAVRDITYFQANGIWNVSGTTSEGRHFSKSIDDKDLEENVGDELAEAMRSNKGELDDDGRVIKGDFKLPQKLKGWTIDMYRDKIPKVLSKLLGVKAETGYVDADNKIEPVTMFRLTPEAISKVKQGYTLYQFPFINPAQLMSAAKSLIKSVKDMRSTQAFYSQRKERNGIVGATGTVDVVWKDNPDISAALPFFTHSFLFNSEVFKPYRHHVTDVAEALLHISNDNADIKLFLEEIKAKLDSKQVSKLTEAGYRVDSFDHRIVARTRQKLIRQGMDKKLAYEQAIKDTRQIVEAYKDKIMPDPLIRNTYDTLRNSFFEPFRKKMQNLMRTRVEMNLQPSHKQVIDAIKGGQSPAAALQGAGIISASDIKAFIRALKKYKNIMDKIDNWGERSYWSRSMPGNWLISTEIPNAQGTMQKKILGVAKTLSAARTEAIEAATTAGIPITQIDIKEKAYTKSRHITDVFVGATKPTQRVMKGLKDIFDTAEYYATGMNKKVYLDPVSWKIKQAIPNMPKNIARHITKVFQAAKGEYSIFDEKLDSIVRELTKGAVMPYKSFSRAVESVRGAAIRAKLMYRPISETVNVVDGLWRIASDMSTSYLIQAEKMLYTPAGKKWLLDNKWILGMKAFEMQGHLTTGTHMVGHTFVGAKNIIMPMGRWQQGELIIRPVNALAAYLKYKADRLAELQAQGKTIPNNQLEHEAQRAVIESIAMLQGLNIPAMLPEWMRSPVGRMFSPLRALPTRTLEWFFMRYKDPKFWFKYGSYIALLGGPRAFMKMIKGFTFISALATYFGLPDMWEKADEYLLRKYGAERSLSALVSGLPGLIGVDISDPVSIQFPLSFNEMLTGLTIATAKKLWDNVVVPIQEHDLNKEAEFKRAAKDFIPAVRDAWNVFDSIMDKDGWVYDERGNKKFNLTNNWERAMALINIKQTSKAYDEDISRIARQAENRHNKNAVNTLEYFANMTRRHGDQLPESVWQKIEQSIIDNQIPIESIKNKMKSVEMTPAQRLIFSSRMIDREMVFEKMIEAGKTFNKDYLTGKQLQ